jgi:hypothetical protein
VLGIIVNSEMNDKLYGIGDECFVICKKNKWDGVYSLRKDFIRENTNVVIDCEIYSSRQPWALSLRNALAGGGGEGVLGCKLY